MDGDAFSSMRELCASLAASYAKLEQLAETVSDRSIGDAIVRTKDMQLMTGFVVAVGETHSVAIFSLACILYQIALSSDDSRTLLVRKLPSVLRMAEKEFRSWPQAEIAAARRRAEAELETIFGDRSFAFAEIVDGHIARICCKNPEGKLARRTKALLHRWLV